MGNYNVVDNYDWTLNKGVDIPYVKLRELEFKGSPVAAGYAHFARFTINLPTVSKFVLPCIADKLNTGEAKSEAQHMNPYAGLYSLKPTGNIYKFPYLSNDAYGRTNSWEETYGGDDDNLLASMGASIAKGINKYSAGGGFGALSGPGVFVERVRFYQPSDASGNQISINFPLLNTQSEGGLSKNQELIKILAKNTSPSRQTKSILLPPKLYEVRVPGIRFIKYAYISPYSVDLLGTRRMINGKVVPEAFLVNITVNSLTDESGNFLIESQSKRF